MVGLIAVLIMAQQAPATTIRVPPRQDTDAQACVRIRKIADDTTRELPVMVDAITRTDGMSVICALRTVTFNKSILVELGQFREGWADRMQSQWNQIICRNGAFSPLQKRGWRFAQNMTFRSGERVTYDASCK